MLLSCLILTGFGAAAAESPKPDGGVTCNAAYRQAAQGNLSCQALFDFRDRCSDSLHATVASTALRLRCSDALFERDYKAVQRDFARAAQPGNCASMTAFVNRYALDYRLADAPEMEKATGTRIRLCEQEAREREVAALDTDLRSALDRNDCATFQGFERQRGQKLSAGQASRLAAALKPRCELETKASAALQACLDKNDSAGYFCDSGGDNCFAAYRRALPQDTYFVSHRAESERRDRICAEFQSTRKCFLNDECGGEQCSLSLRLAVKSGPLIGRIQAIEQEASRRCNVKRESERLAREAAERERRKNQTVKLTICNQSQFNTILISVVYNDYDANNWFLEGWWSVAQGCVTLGDKFSRGRIFIHAQVPGTAGSPGEVGFCIYPNRHFRMVLVPGARCSTSRFRYFKRFEVNNGESTIRFGPQQPQP
jgi:uncharacterized membrane protein